MSNLLDNNLHRLLLKSTNNFESHRLINEMILLLLLLNNHVLSKKACLT